MRKPDFLLNTTFGFHCINSVKKTILLSVSDWNNLDLFGLDKG